MPLPEPRLGLVFRYDYLWSRDSVSGRDQGKERPACLVAATDPAINPRFVVVVPITHSPPSGDTVGIEIPPRVRQAIGLDNAPCWVIVSEHNVDEPQAFDVPGEHDKAKRQRRGEQQPQGAPKPSPKRRG